MYVAVDRPGPVVALIAADEHRGLVPWPDLTPVTGHAGGQPEPEPFPVCPVTITNR